MGITKELFRSKYDELNKKKDNDSTLAERAAFDAKDNLPVFLNCCGQSLSDAIERAIDFGVDDGSDLEKAAPAVLSAATLRRWIIKFDYKGDSIGKSELVKWGLVDKTANAFILFNDDEYDYKVFYDEEKGCTLCLNSPAFDGGKRNFSLTDEPQRFFFGVAITAYDENDEEDNEECSEPQLKFDDSISVYLNSDEIQSTCTDYNDQNQFFEIEEQKYAKLDKPALLLVVDVKNNDIVETLKRTDDVPANDWLDGFTASNNKTNAYIAFLDGRKGELKRRGKKPDVYCDVLLGVRSMLNYLCLADEKTNKTWFDVVRENKEMLFERNEKQCLVLLTDGDKVQAIDRLSELKKEFDGVTFCLIRFDESYKYLILGDDGENEETSVAGKGKAALKTIFERIKYAF